LFKVDVLVNCWLEIDFISRFSVSSKLQINWLNKSRRRFSFWFRCCLYKGNESTCFLLSNRTFFLPFGRRTFSRIFTWIWSFGFVISWCIHIQSLTVTLKTKKQNKSKWEIIYKQVEKYQRYENVKDILNVNYYSETRKEKKNFCRF